MLPVPTWHHMIFPCFENTIAPWNPLKSHCFLLFSPWKWPFHLVSGPTPFHSNGIHEAPQRAKSPCEVSANPWQLWQNTSNYSWVYEATKVTGGSRATDPICSTVLEYLPTCTNHNKWPSQVGKYSHPAPWVASGCHWTVRWWTHVKSLSGCPHCIALPSRKWPDCWRNQWPREGWNRRSVIFARGRRC